MRVTLSIEAQDLADFDEWCRAARLPRGAGIAALLRLVRSLSSASNTITQLAQRATNGGAGVRQLDVVEAGSMRPLKVVDSETVAERWVDPEPPWVV